MKQTFKKFETIEQKNQWKDQQKQRVDQVMKDIFQKFKTEDFLDFASKQYLKSYEVPSDKWSLSNRFAMFLSGTSDARGFHQWNKVGRYVKKGAKAVYILAPNQKVIEKEKEVLKDGKKEIEKVKIPIIWFKAVPVFRFEDTDGEDIKYVEKPKQEIPLKEIFEKFGLQIVYDRSIQGEYGSYNQQTKQIRI
ncbi:MAG: hypothetical protein R3321_09010, partial [Nitrososphaeraceae archaeon]|nr:hypothetical protein [Nitrososphaeraceae archaeon]